ncbi:MAG: hypothetical protein NC081_07830 [Roseburia sp.]|nr:hypothetical protein [Roseburia sp.]
MKKPTYYLWRSDYGSEEELWRVRCNLAKAGFRVVVFSDGGDGNIREGIQKVIRGHMQS